MNLVYHVKGRNARTGGISNRIDRKFNLVIIIETPRWELRTGRAQFPISNGSADPRGY